MRDTFARTLLEIAKGDPNVYLITGDLGFGVLQPFWEALPAQFINAGIAEQNMTGLAAGMALEGKTIFTYSIGNFPTLRCVEQIRNDCAYHNANVKIVCVGGGFVYGALGMSHHATEDIAVMRALPNVVVMAPGDPIEAEHATRAIYTHPGTCYLRLGRGGEKTIHKGLDHFAIGESIKVKDGEKVALCTTGAIFEEAWEAEILLSSQGINAALFTFPTVKPLDREAIETMAKQFDLLVTVEEHSIIGGLGGAVAEVLAEMKGPKATLKRIGLNDMYSSIVGSQKYLRNYYGMSAEKITRSILEDLK